MIQFCAQAIVFVVFFLIAIDVLNQDCRLAMVAVFLLTFMVLYAAGAFSTFLP